MSVTGYLALYTTLLGWQQYQNLWSIAVGTGLLYLPFIGIVLSTTTGPFTSMGAKDAAQIAIRRMTLQVLAAFMIITFAAVPGVSLDPTVLHYEPFCEDTHSATPGHTGTTYDNAFPVATGVKVPIFWYLVMSFANGVTHAASEGLSCSPYNLRELHSQLDLAKIQDPQLKQEATDFYKDCYVPAYSSYLSGQLSLAQQQQIQQSLQKNGQDDIGWLGSQTLLNVTGLYDAHNATQPVNGFVFDAQRDQEEGQVSSHSQWGMPDCKSWWSDPENGLQTRLKQAMPPSFWQQLSGVGGDQQKLQDATLKTLITHSFTNGQSASDTARGYESLNNNVHGDYFSRFIGAPMGVRLESLSFYPKIHLLINALPVVQGALLFAVYAFLALGIPFSSYRISFCVTGAVVLFSLIFCTFIWNLVQWFDTYLMQALYPSLGNVAGVGAIFNEVSNDINGTFVDIVTGILYIVLPILWMAVMSWCGYHAGLQAAGLFGTMFAASNQAGEKAGNIASSAISSAATSGVTRGITK
jgi:hypothetical protein